MVASSRKLEIQKTRSVFKYAYETGLIDRPARQMGGQMGQPASHGCDSTPAA